MAEKTKSVKLIAPISWVEVEKRWLKDRIEELSQNLEDEIPEEEKVQELEYFKRQSELLLEGNIRELINSIKARFYSTRYLINLLLEIPKVYLKSIEVGLAPFDFGISKEAIEQEIIKAEKREKNLENQIFFEIVSAIEESKKKKSPDIYAIKKTFGEENLVEVSGNLLKDFRKIEEVIRQQIESINDKKISSWLNRKLYYEMKELKHTLESPKTNPQFKVISPVFSFFKESSHIANIYILLYIWLKEKLALESCNLSFFIKGNIPIAIQTFLPKNPIQTLNFDSILYRLVENPLQKKREDKEKILKAQKKLDKYNLRNTKNIYYSGTLEGIHLPPYSKKFDKDEEITLHKDLILGVLENGEIASFNDLKYLLAVLHCCKLIAEDIRKTNNLTTAELDQLLKVNPFPIELSKVAGLLGEKPREEIYQAILNALFRFRNTLVVNGKIKVRRNSKKEIITKNFEYEAFIHRVKRIGNTIEIELSNFLREGVVYGFFNTYRKDIIFSMDTYVFRFFNRLLPFIKRKRHDKTYNKPQFIKNSTLEEWLGLHFYDSSSRKQVRRKAKNSLIKASKEGIKIKSSEREERVKLFELEFGITGKEGAKGINIWFCKEGIEQLFPTAKELVMS